MKFDRETFISFMTLLAFTAIIAFVLVHINDANAQEYDGSSPWCLDNQGRTTYDLHDCMGNGKMTQEQLANLQYAELEMAWDAQRNIAYYKSQQSGSGSGGQSGNTTLVNEPNTQISNGSDSHSSVGNTSANVNSSISASNSNANTNNNRLTSQVSNTNINLLSQTQKVKVK